MPKASPTPKKGQTSPFAIKGPYRLWDGEFDVLDQAWTFTIRVDGSRHCILTGPNGVPVEVFLQAGTYKIKFPPGSMSPLRSFAIDPDPGTGRIIP